MTKPPAYTNTLQKSLRILLRALMVLAAMAHLTVARTDFQAQVSNWLPFNKDLVVILSGIIESVLGLSMIFWKTQRINVGIALALFYLLIFPGNIAQYLNHTSAFHLTTDRARLIRLFFQPVLVAWALWSSGALKQVYNFYFSTFSTPI